MAEEEAPEVSALPEESSAAPETTVTLSCGAVIDLEATSADLSGYEVTDLMDDRTCASFQFGNEFIDPDVLRNFAVDYYNSLADIAVRDKLALVRKAVFAEINNYPLPKFISSNDLYLAEQAMVSALDNWAKGTSEDKVHNFALVLTNPGAFRMLISVLLLRLF